MSKNIDSIDISALNNLLNEFNVPTIADSKCFIKTTSPTNLMDLSQRMFETANGDFMITVQVNGVKYNNKKNIWSQYGQFYME